MYTVSKLSGTCKDGLPNRTPLAFAAAIPSIVREQMNSRSFCATYARICRTRSPAHHPLADLVGNRIPLFLGVLIPADQGVVASTPNQYCMNPRTDFSRHRKPPLERLIASIIGLGGGTLSLEIMEMFKYSSEIPSASAFVQQRNKLKPNALEDLFIHFTQQFSAQWKGDMRLLAVDGTDLHIFTDPNDKGSYYLGANGQKPYNLLHVNALYDLKHGIYTDSIVQKRNEVNEHRALCTMVDRSMVQKAILLADRGYESYNNLAHLQKKGWFFLIRIKDGNRSIKGSLMLPDSPTFDINIDLNLTRKHSKEVKSLCKDLFYPCLSSL